MQKINPTTFRAGANGKTVEIRGNLQFEIAINNFSFSLSPLPGPPAFANDKLSRSNGIKTHEIVEIIDADPEKSGLQITIIYQSKPTENEQITLNAGEIWYQPPLTEEIPENIHPKAVTITETQCFDINGNLVQERPYPRSYDVMSGGMFNTIEWTFYPVKLVDSVNNEVSVPMILAGNILTIDVLSQTAWLDTAAYPVRLV